MPTTPTISQLSTVISQATAPAFLLGALSGFIAILVARLNRIIDSDTVRTGATQTVDVQRLKRRAVLINRAILWAVASSIATALLLIVAFVIAYYDFPHEYGVAILFIVALGTFTFALINFAREVHMAVMDFEH
ncbi:MAG: DUF2721 domain-containing protein, partial [Bradyrhizobium sp.]